MTEIGVWLIIVGIVAVILIIGLTWAVDAWDKRKKCKHEWILENGCTHSRCSKCNAIREVEGGEQN